MQIIRSLPTTGDNIMANLGFFNQYPFRALQAHHIFDSMSRNTSLEFPVCGVGEGNFSVVGGDSFVLLSTQSLTLVPRDVHAIVLPEEMKVEIGDNIIFSIDDPTGSTLSIKSGDGAVRQVFVNTPSRHFALWHKMLVYKKVRGHFELITVDGRNVS